MAPVLDAPKKDRFVNNSGGILGVVVRDPGGKGGFKGIPMYPGHTVDLDEEEQAMTANAPRDPRSNPLGNGQLGLVAEGLDFKGRRPLRPDPNIATADPANPATWSAVQTGDETGAVVPPSTQPPVGAFDPFEETGAPPTPGPAPVGGAFIGGIEATPEVGEPVEIVPGAPGVPESEIVEGGAITRDAPKVAVGQLSGTTRGPKRAATTSA